MARMCIALGLISFTVIALDYDANARGQTTPPPETRQAEPTPAELMQQIEALRDEMRRQQESHEQQLQSLQKQIAELKEKGSASAQAQTPPSDKPPPSAEDELEALISGANPPSAATGEAKSPGPLAMSVQGAVQSFNPDISINVDFLGTTSSREGGNPDDEFLFREFEFGFSGAVDPYTRADVIATIAREDNDWKTDLEEGYLTFLQLPYNLQARVGQFRAEFGRVNAIHRHAIPWIDYPLVIQRNFGDEGLSGAGVELSWLIPNKWNKYMSLTYEIINNDNDSLFAGADSDDFAHIVRFKTFQDLSPASNVEMGTSVATAPNDGGHGGSRATVEGFDLTYRWKPKDTGSYHSFLWQTEALLTQSDHPTGHANTWGMYSAAEYQFAKRWKFGLRYDYTMLPISTADREQAYSAYLTFLQSEFVFWRLGYLYADRTFPQDGNYDEHQIQLQLNYTLGAHPAHKF